MEYCLNRLPCRFLSRCVVLILAIFSYIEFAYSQQSTPADQKVTVPTFSVTSRLVLVDAVVTDKAGNPVTNLTKDDFAVYEDKVAQRVASFEPPSAHSLPLGNDNAPLNSDNPKSFGQSPVTILVLDEA